MDPELPLYFWTAKTRYREWDEELESFNERPHVEDEEDVLNHPLRLHRLTINRQEDPSQFSKWTCTLSTKKSAHYSSKCT